RHYHRARPRRRLRHGQRHHPPHPHRLTHRLARLHGPRAGHGRRRRPLHRPLRPRRPHARTAQRRRAVRRLHRPRRPAPPPLRAARARPPAPPRGPRGPGIAGAAPAVPGPAAPPRDAVPLAGSPAPADRPRHLHAPPAAVRRLGPEVPEALESLVLRLLSKDPQPRPAPAQEVYEHLALLLPSRGTPTGSPLDPTRPFLRPLAPWPDRARTPAPQPAPATPPAPAAEKADRAVAVDEVKRLLGEGRITQAVDILGGILPVAAEQHGEHSPVVRTLRKQYAATLLDDGQYRRALPELR